MRTFERVYLTETARQTSVSWLSVTLYQSSRFDSFCLMSCSFSAGIVDQRTKLRHFGFAQSIVENLVHLFAGSRPKRSSARGGKPRIHREGP